MLALQNKKILLGISGGIAAYKCPELVRRLKELGADVRVVLTNGGKAFVTPLSLQAVSANPVSDDLLDPTAEAAMGHIELAKWADLILIAPASANLIARVAHGMADDLLTTLVLATNAPIAIAPAMNQQMWAAKAVQDNLAVLLERGVDVIGPASGEQACGDMGSGRMTEPTDIRTRVISLLSDHADLWQNQSITITAGPTREAIDPVRYISNHSSGKMGYALAEAAQQLGAKVTLISGPVDLAAPAGVERVWVETAEDMLAAVQQQTTDIFISCAAVADYRAAQVAEQKLKKQRDDNDMSLQLCKNPDILQTIATQSNPPFCIGFAAETESLREHALDKLSRKKLRLIVANDVSDSSIGFNSSLNAVSVFWQGGEQHFEAQSKKALAQQLNQLFAEHYFQSTTTKG